MATVVNGGAKGPQRVTLVAVADQQGGPVILTNATVLGFLFGNGPLHTIWTRVYADQAQARAVLLAGVSGFAIDRGFETHAVRTLNNLGAATWAVDVAVDGNGFATLSLTPSAGSSVAVFELEAIWTPTR